MLPFEVAMALNDTIKAKKLVEYWKWSIRNVDQGRQVPRRRLVKCLSNLFARNMKSVFWDVCFAKARRTAFNVGS